MSFRFEFTRRPEFFEVFDDFAGFAATDWVITTTEAGAGSASEVLSDAAGGVLVVTNDNADDDADFFQWAGGAGAVTEQFRFTAGKKLYFGIRFKLSDATQSDFIAGLVITDTAPLAHTDGIVFQKDDGDTNVDAHVTKDSTATDVTAATTLADDTWATLEFYYDGGDTIALFKDGAGIGKAAITNAPDDEDLAVTFGIQNGAAAAKTLSVDWIRAVQER